MKIRLEDILPGDQIRGEVHECPECGSWFIGSKVAVYCCEYCKKKAKKKRKEREQGK